MVIIDVTIKGLEPGILQHKCPVIFGKTSVAIKYSKPEEEAEAGCYRLENGNLYQPANHLEASMIAAASRFKIGRISAASVAAAAFTIKPDCLDHGTKEYKIDLRPIVNPSTRGRVTRARANLWPWELSFELKVDDSLVSVELARDILDTAGKQKGIGDYRIGRKGKFGRFIVTRWDVRK